jgi:hypothetical protein
MLEAEPVIQENARRLAAMRAPYDPVRGVGSPLERVAVSFAYRGGAYAWRLPAAMAARPAVRQLQRLGSVERVVEKNQTKGQAGAAPAQAAQSFFEGLCRDRMRHDFEFWAATCATIQRKATVADAAQAGAGDVPRLSRFILRKAQRKLLAELERQREAGQPIRVILLKARQWGGSTLTQLYMQWIQLFHRRRWHACIVADVEEQATTIKEMYELVSREYPPEVGAITLKPLQRSPKNFYFAEREAKNYIASMQKPDNIRAKDIMMAHLSEIGIWKETDGKKPEDVIRSVVGSVPYVPCSMIVKESTARGVGSYFHRAWQDAVSGASSEAPVFVPWHEIDICQLPVEGGYAPFIGSLSEYERYLWGCGATLEGIRWYRQRLKEFNGDAWGMQSENPTTPQEAFQSTGRRVFAPAFVQAARASCCAPTYRGELFAEARKGQAALTNIQLQPTPEGCLWVWALPDSGVAIAHRYALFADIGGRTAKADYSVIRVVDRYPLLEGGCPEMVATWRGHLDQDLFAWKCAQLGAFYGGGLLAVEVNSVKKDMPDGGEHHLTVLDQIGESYPNLYARSSPEDIRMHRPTKWGFHTNAATKPMIMDALNAALRDGGYVERDARACDEMDSYEEKPDKTMGAVAGAHDDLAITTAGAVWLATAEGAMPPVRRIPKPDQQPRRESAMRSAAAI